MSAFRIKTKTLGCRKGFQLVSTLDSKFHRMKSAAHSSTPPPYPQSHFTSLGSLETIWNRHVIYDISMSHLCKKIPVIFPIIPIFQLRHHSTKLFQALGRPWCRSFGQLHFQVTCTRDVWIPQVATFATRDAWKSRDQTTDLNRTELNIKLGVSENSVPLSPMVKDHYPY